jgi:recombination protein RecA
MLVRSNAVDVVIVDSVAALTPRAEIEGEMGDQLPGLQARLMSQALRKLTGNIKRSGTLVVFINQLRHKIGQMMPGQSPEVTTGGNALKFYASVRLDIRRIGAVKKGDEIIGNQTRIKVVKNKLAPPFKQVVTEILYGEGISREGELIEMGMEAKLVERAGAWYSMGEERIGQGKENARQYLKDNPVLAEQLEAELRKRLVPVEAAPAAVDGDADDESGETAKAGKAGKVSKAEKLEA